MPGQVTVTLQHCFVVVTSRSHVEIIRRDEQYAVDTDRVVETVKSALANTDPGASVTIGLDGETTVRVRLAGGATSDRTIQQIVQGMPVELIGAVLAERDRVRYAHNCSDYPGEGCAVPLASIPHAQRWV